MTSLIVLIGAGQGVSSTSGQFIPKSQPDNTVIHLVDPMSGMGADQIGFIKSHLSKLNSANRFFKQSFMDYVQHQISLFDTFDKVIFISYTIQFEINPQDILPNSLFLNFGHSSESLDLNRLLIEINGSKYTWNELKDISQHLSNLLVETDKLVNSKIQQSTVLFDPQLYNNILDALQPLISNIKYEFLYEILDLIVGQLRFCNNYIKEAIGLLDRQQLSLFNLNVDHKQYTITTQKDPNNAMLNRNLSTYYKLFSFLIKSKFSLVKSTKMLKIGNNEFYYYDIIQGGGVSQHRYKYIKYKLKYKNYLTNHFI